MTLTLLAKRSVPTCLALLGLLGTPLFALPPGVGALTFSDEFNGTALDLSKWMHRAPGPRQEAFNTPDAVSVGGGLLTIKTYTEAGTNFTGMIATAGHFEQTYGYFEARVRFHTSSGQWAAFWLQSLSIGNPIDAPEKAGVEVDIFEHRVRDPFDGLVPPDEDVSNRGHQALVWNGYGPASKSKANLTPPLPGLANDTWHTWGLSWGPDGYTFFYDDKPVWTQDSPVSKRSQYLILSSEVWSKFAGPIPSGGYGSRATTTTDFQVDYVRVYKHPARPLAKTRAKGKPLYTFTLAQDGTRASYDEATAAATLQGIINRKAPELYLLSRKTTRPQFWLDLLAKDGRWLQGREQKALPDLDALARLAGKRLKGALIWDPDVPASLNVATTLAGVHDAVVLSPELAERYLAKWRLPLIKDLRGQFTGAETGSRKNDAYRWAIREYLAKGRCASHRLCLFEDAFSARARGDIGYVLTRDWAVKSRAFVFDLSPWGDEVPGDDPGQRRGLDLETYKLILAETLRQSAGKHMTELTGFFVESKYANCPSHKSAHEGVPTEWETVWLISPFNCYQNTISSDCFNQSLHSQAPRQPLTQRSVAKPVTLEKKAYVCILMTDYDSATPLYDFLPNHWHNPARGKVPLGWGINPSLLETYPDLIAYFYETASPADTFTADASAAGYMNPNQVRKEYLPLFVRHNRQFFKEADMTIAPMVLDQNEPSPEVKDAFQQFAPDGFATIVQDEHRQGGHLPQRQVWKGMPVLELLNDACNSNQSGQIADVLANAIQGRGNVVPGFYLFRTVWINPTTIHDALAALRAKHPEVNFEVLGPKPFFALFKESLERQKQTTRP